MPFQKGNRLQPKSCSEETRRKISIATQGRTAWNKGKKFPHMSGPNSPVWSLSPSYHAVHQWLQREYGRASKCEMENCSGKSQSYEWALKKGFQYVRSREAFFELCVSCHRKYDFTDEERAFVASRKRVHGRFI